jgi:hypothetical protein
MATWIVHLRIAEQLLKTYDFHEVGFVSGNIAPDCGAANEDWSAFDPPKQVTHWLNDTNKNHNLIDGTKIDVEAFYQQYVQKEVRNLTDERYAFLVGYYVHLLTDIKWATMHRLQKKANPEYAAKLIADPKFIWEVKEDWYGLDFLYLEKNKDNIFTNVFCKIDSVKDHLDYFPPSAFTNQFNYIKNYYTSSEKASIPTDRYLKNQEMDHFIEETTKFISQMLVDLQLIN